MLEVQTFTFNPFQENTYLILNENRECWIVDPGMYDNTETELFFVTIRERGLTPKAIINTHTHLDHIFGVAACRNRFDIPFLIHQKDLPVLKSAKGSAAMFGLQLSEVPEPDGYLEDGKAFPLGQESLDVRFVPGHSPGSILFYYAPGGWCIGGDVLFSGSVGRTDLPGGSFDVLIESIRTQILDLPDDTVVYSGHGPATTVGRERLYNPFLQDI